MFYPSVRDAAAHSDNGAQVKVSNRTYRVVLSDNRFCVTRESHSGCFTNMLYSLDGLRERSPEKLRLC